MKNKKGLSTIVATLIIILLVLVAVGIIWVVVRNVIDTGTQGIQSGFDCTNAIVKPTRVLCPTPGPGGIGNDGECTVTLEREAGGDDFGGVKVILYNDNANHIEDVEGNMNELEVKTTSAIDTGLNNVTRVETSVYFLDESGNELTCSPSGYMNVQLD